MAENDKPAVVEDSVAERFDRFVKATSTRVVAAMPISVPTAGLERARALIRVAFSADAHGDLWKCTPESVARAMVLSAISGCMPGGPRPDVWLIPRKNRHRNNALEVNWQMSYRGYIRLARRAGWDLETVLVHEADEFDYVEGLAPSITHRPRDLEARSWQTLRLLYVRTYPLGNRVPEATKFAVMTRAEIERRRAKAQDDSVWTEWPLEQALKTGASYAGARELFPTDDAARFAMDADVQTTSELGGSAFAGGSISPTAGAELEASRAALAPAPETLDAVVEREPETRAEPTPPAKKGTLATDILADLKSYADRSGVAWERVEEAFAGEPEMASGPDLRKAIDRLKAGSK